MGKKLEQPKADKKQEKKSESKKKTEDQSVTIDGEPLDDDLLAVMGSLEQTDNPWFDMSGYSDPELSEREMTIGEKSTQVGNYRINNDSGKRLDKVDNKSHDVAMPCGVVSYKSDNVNHYEGILGTFDYNTNEWAIAEKKVKGEDGRSTEIPVLRYIGNETDGDKIKIPEGVKSLDYSFEGNTKLETVPKIPDSVTSAHASFMGCNHLKRACKSAKEGEKEGAFDLAGWTAGGAASGAAVGAGIGLSGAPVTAGISVGAGAGVGAIIGGVGGAVKGTYEYVTGDGKGGSWKMPPNLVDTSSMFDGCESLEESFASGHDKLLFVRNMYGDTTNMGQDEKAMKLGATAVTDFTSAKQLSKEAVQDSYDGTNVDLLEDLKDNYSLDWDESSGKLNGNADLAEKARVENLSAALKAKDIENGVVDNAMSDATGGLAHTASKRTASGMKKTTDPTDVNTDADKSSGEFGDLAGILDRGLVSFGEYKLLKLVTGSTLLSAGITFGGQILGILPTSIKPVLSAIAGFVGEDNPVGSALNKIVDKLPDTDDKAKTVQAAGLGGSVTNNFTSETASRIDTSMKDGLTVAAKGGTDDISTMMSKNGEMVASDGTLLTIGKEGVDSNSLKEVNSIALLTSDALEEKAQSLASASGGKLSEEDKKELSDCVMTTVSGLESYNQSASHKIDTEYGVGSEQGDIAHIGLKNTMTAVAEPLKESICELNAQYDFLSDEDQKRLDSMSVSEETTYGSLGVGVSDDDAIYANAYLSEDTGAQASEDDKPDKNKSEKTDKADDKSNAKSDKKNKKSRGEMAAETLGTEDIKVKGETKQTGFGL